MNILISKFQGSIFSLLFWGLCGLALGLGFNLYQSFQNGPEEAIAAHQPRVEPARKFKAEAGKPLAEYNILARSSIFSTTPKQSAAKSVKNRPKTELKGYRLVGLMTGPQGMAMAAVESIRSREQSLVSLGDTLGNGRVVAISSKGIEVEAGGLRLALTIPDNTSELAQTLEISGADTILAQTDSLTNKAGHGLELGRSMEIGTADRRQ